MYIQRPVQALKVPEPAQLYHASLESREDVFCHSFWGYKAVSVVSICSFSYLNEMLVAISLPVYQVTCCPLRLFSFLDFRILFLPPRVFRRVIWPAIFVNF